MKRHTLRCLHFRCWYFQTIGIFYSHLLFFFASYFSRICFLLSLWMLTFSGTYTYSSWILLPRAAPNPRPKCHGTAASCRRILTFVFNPSVPFKRSNGCRLISHWHRNTLASKQILFPTLPRQNFKKFKWKLTVSGGNTSVVGIFEVEPPSFFRNAST